MRERIRKLLGMQEEIDLSEYHLFWQRCRELGVDGY